MSYFFNISFSDLINSKQEELIETVAQNIVEEWQVAGEELMSREWCFGQPESWQEAYMRDVQSYDEEDLEMAIDWEYEVLQLAEKEATNRLYQSFKYVDVEVSGE